MRFQGQKFLKQEINMDFNQFVECEFEDCTMLYHGYGPFELGDCSFRNVKWGFLDAAARTVTTMSDLYTGLGEEGRQLIDSIFEKIKAGQPFPNIMPNDEQFRVSFGGSSFTDFSVPLICQGRYFIIEPGEPPLITVLLEKDGQVVFEILKNRPSPNEFTEVTSTPPGIVTVTDSETGKFLYKVRPENETSVVFGKLDGGEVPVLINDRKIMVGTSPIENCLFRGSQAGITVFEDGSFVIGGAIPPIVLGWLKSKDG